MVKIAPSLMCANLTRLGEDVQALDEAGADLFHFDIMDGHFVENLTLSPDILAAIRGLTELPIEAHLMVSEPEKFLEMSARAGADIITVHAEVCPRPYQVLAKISELGCVPGLALNPATPLCFLDYLLPEVGILVLMTVDPGFAGQDFIRATLPKIREVRRRIDEQNLYVEIQVDGHINRDTIPLVAEAGADILVLGTSGLFSLPGSFRDNIRAAREQAASVNQR
jgi:ribulose-phosphate 3-epimerase